MEPIELSRQRYFQVGATKYLLDELIDQHAEAYLVAYPEVKEFSNFEKSGTGNYYIGMVWTSDNEKPDTQQLKIRGSQFLTQNKMLELDLTAVDSQQSFFPGQIIAFLADPYVKRQLTVRKLLDPMRIAPQITPIHTERATKLMIACGPYMKPEREDWSLYDKIIEQAKDNQVSRLVLVGPFVDLENKTVRANYDVNWRLCFDKLIEGLLDQECIVYIVSSSRDVLPSYLSATYYYPSPPLNIDVRLKKDVKPKCKILSVSDPAQIDLGGIHLDVTSAEVLFQLNKCSSFINKGGSTFSSIHRSLLSHGIYPIYPPPSEVAVDYPKLAQHIHLTRRGPHIIVLPTRFNTAITNVENRLVVSIQKCSTKKQVVYIEIPKIESSPEAPIDSVVISDYTHKIIDLSVKEVEATPLPESLITIEPMLAIE